MFRKVVFALLIALTFGASKFKNHKHRPDGRIIGGHNADIADYPHQISLQYDGGHNCGGSIISENYIVTAAHCTDGSEAQDLSIRANSSIIEQGGVVVDVKKINQNPFYDKWFTDYDISILELAEPLKLGRGIQPIQLPKMCERITDGTEVLVTGWGALEEDDSELSSQLQVVKVNIVNNHECQKDYGNEEITDRMICAGIVEGGKDSCQGDSGGPLISNGVLWGIVSWGYGCAEKGYPGVYASVAALRDYITEVTGL